MVIFFGHEFMGEVVETGHDVKNIRKGERVVIPFVIACGDCFFCRLQQYSACENTNDGHGAAMNKKQIPPPAALFGYSHLYGGVPGGQAEYVRVPKGNVGPFKVPPLLSDDKALFLLIFCLPPGRRQKMLRFSKVPAWRFLAQGR